MRLFKYEEKEQNLTQTKLSEGILEPEAIRDLSVESENCAGKEEKAARETGRKRK